MKIKSKPVWQNKRFWCAIESLEVRQFLSTTTIFVDASSTGPTHDGTTWNTAFIDLQQALTSFDDHPDNAITIDVAKGTYKPTSGTDRTISFQIPRNVNLIGGYAGTTAADPNSRDVSANPTILSGDIGKVDDNSDNSQTIIRASSSSTQVLDGLTVTGARNAGSTGGGMYCSGPETENGLIVRNCTFKANTTTRFGEGEAIYISGGFITIQNCSFINNGGSVTTGMGGAIFNFGEGASITNCLFEGNMAASGGAVEDESATSIFTNCQFIGNSSSSGDAVLEDGQFGPATSVFENCTFMRNGEVGHPDTGDATIVSRAETPILNNSIIWGLPASRPAIFVWGNSRFSINYSDIQGDFASSGNTAGITSTAVINIDPKFVRNPSPGADAVWGTADDDLGNLQLQSASPAIDAGNNAVVTTGTSADYAGNARFIDIPSVPNTGSGTAPIVDMGAFETQLAIAVTSSNLNVNAAAPTLNFVFNNQLSTTNLPTSQVTINVVNANGKLGATVAATSVSYDSSTKTLSFALPRNLASANYHAVLRANGISDNTGSSLLTNATADFFFLAGDTDHDRDVDNADFGNFFSNFGKPSGATFAQGDFDYDGDVDNADFGIFFSNFGKVLAPPPVQATSTVVATTTSTSFSTVQSKHLWQRIEPVIPLLKR